MSDASASDAVEVKQQQSASASRESSADKSMQQKQPQTGYNSSKGSDTDTTKVNDMSQRAEGQVAHSAATSKRIPKQPQSADNPNAIVMVKKKVKKKKDDGKQDANKTQSEMKQKPDKAKKTDKKEKQVSKDASKTSKLNESKQSKLVDADVKSNNGAALILQSQKEQNEQKHLQAAMGLTSPETSAEKPLSSARSSPLEVFEESKARSSSSDIQTYNNETSNELSEFKLEKDQSQVLPASPASKTLQLLDLKASEQPECTEYNNADNSPLSPDRLITQEEFHGGNKPQQSQFSLKPQFIEAGNEDQLLITKKPSYAVRQDELPDAVPLYPKQTNFVYGPPKCPLDGVKFLQLKRFYNQAKSPVDQMTSGFELVGQRRKLINLRTKEKIEKKENGGKNTEMDAEAKMDATTHFIKNIVYARDPTILDKETLHVNQRAAFSHENMLDVKKMMHKSQALQHDDQMNYRMAALQRSPLMRRGQPQGPPKPRPLDSQIVQPVDENDKTLMFESRFESGNLYLSQKVSDSEYNLLMQNDVNTCGHTQWFFFRVQNTKAGHKVKFNILNYSKPDSLFNYGMKVSIYSDRMAEEKKIGWHKGGEDISYFPNGIRKDVLYSSKSFYTATFTYKFKHSGDSIYFAYSQPYSYSELRDDIAAIEADPDRGCFVTTKTLCTTLAGNPCEYLTITSKKKDKDVLDLAKRKGVIITARVHPGETVGSHMMKGVLEFLTHPLNVEAKMLRENFVFKVIPMLNPDGVINGNYRCSLAGCDLNRRWKAPSKLLHPTVYYTKKLLKQIHEERGVVMFCDLHGHSRKQNVFMYGCNKKDNPGICRAFPFLMSKINPYFSFDYSRFGVQKSKESTARVAMFKELRNVPCIYTMESSFAGVDMGKAAGQHLSSEMLMTLGKDLCRSILAYQNLYIAEELKDLPMFKRKLEQKDLGQKDFSEDSPVNIFDAILEEFKENKALLEQGDGESSSGSDDMPSEDNLPAEVIVKQLPPEKAKPEPKVVVKKEPVKKPVNDRQKPQPIKKPEPVPEKVRAEPSPSRKPVPIIKKDEPVIESKPEEKKTKKKVETRDAWTQTDKSATAEYKAKLQREKARLAAQQQQQQDQLKNPQYYNSQQTSIKSVQPKNSNPVLNNANGQAYQQLKGGSYKQGGQKLYQHGQPPAEQFNQAQFMHTPQHMVTAQLQKTVGQQQQISSQSQQNGFFSLNNLNRKQTNNQHQPQYINSQTSGAGFNHLQKAQIEMQQRSGAGGGFSQQPRSQRENQIQGIRNINHGQSNTDRTNVQNNGQSIQNALSQQSVVQNSFGKNQLDLGKNHPVIMSNNLQPNLQNSSSNFTNFVNQSKTSQLQMKQQQQRQGPGGLVVGTGASVDVLIANSVQGQAMSQSQKQHHSFHDRPSGKQIILIDKKASDFNRMNNDQFQRSEPESPATYAQNFKKSVMKNHNGKEMGGISAKTVPTSQFQMMGQVEQSHSQQLQEQQTTNSSTKLVTATTNPNSITPSSEFPNSSYRSKLKSNQPMTGNSNTAQRQHQQAMLSQLKQGGDNQQQVRISHPQKTAGSTKGQSWAPVLRSTIDSQGTPQPTHSINSTSNAYQNLAANLGGSGANLRASHNRTQSLNNGVSEISKFNQQVKTNPNGLLSSTLPPNQSRTKLPVLDSRHQPKDNSSTHGGGSVKGQRASSNNLNATIDKQQSLSIQKRLSSNNFDSQPTPSRQHKQQVKQTNKTPISSTGKNPTSVDIVQMSKLENGLNCTPGHQQSNNRWQSETRGPMVQINSQLGGNERAQSSPTTKQNN